MASVAAQGCQKITFGLIEASPLLNLLAARTSFESDGEKRILVVRGQVPLTQAFLNAAADR